MKKTLTNRLLCAIHFLFSTGAVASAAEVPTRVPSFGPNGTHWPSLVPTPFLYEPAKLDIVVNCDWDSIRAALAGIKDAQAAEGVRILVRRGVLVGKGTGSAAVLSDLGSSSWTRRVTVCPLDGYGSVTITGGFTFARVKSVCFAGFYSNGGFFYMDCDRSALAWTRVSGYSSVQSKTTGAVVSKVELTEVVWPIAETTNADVLQLSANTGSFTGYQLEGLWMAPHYYVNDTLPRPHTDTLQIYAAGGGSYKNINLTIRDSVIFGSNNAAFQTGGSQGINLDKVLIIGGQLGKSIYPVTPGGEEDEYFCTLNGAGSDWVVSDSHFFGPMQLSNPNGNFADQPFKSVSSNSTFSGVISGLVIPQSGKWSQVTSAPSYTSKLMAIPDDAYFAKIWGSGRTHPDPEVPDDSLVAKPESGWLQQALTAATGKLRVIYDIRPSGSPIHAVVGLSASKVTGFTDLAVAMRFAENGVVDARSGSVYKADNVLRYSPDVSYRVEFDVDVLNKVYSLTVTPEGQSPVLIAANYAFRTEQAQASSLSNLALKSESGSHVVSGIVHSASQGAAPSPPTGLRVIK